MNDGYYSHDDANHYGDGEFTNELILPKNCYERIPSFVACDFAAAGKLAEKPAFVLIPARRENPICSFTASCRLLLTDLRPVNLGC